MAVYADALEALQIPVEVSGAGAFGESREVRRSRCCCARWPTRRIGVALVGVLRGPLFGLSDRELFAFRQAGGWFSIFAEAPNVGPGRRSAASRRRCRRCGRCYRWTRVLPCGRGARADPRGHRLPRAGRDDAWRRRGRRSSCTPSIASRHRRRRRQPGRRGRRAGAGRGRVERSRVAAARAGPRRRRAADEPAQGQGARGAGRVPGRSLQRRVAAGGCARRATRPTRRAATSRSSASSARARRWSPSLRAGISITPTSCCTSRPRSSGCCTSPPLARKTCW